MALKIYKIAEKVFRHNDSVKGDFVLSKFYAKEEFNKFLVVEIYGSDHLKYAINEIEVYDIGGSVETFPNFDDLFTRLAELRYTGFYADGEFIFDPNDYDLSEFRNDETDRFAKLSDITGGSGTVETIVAGTGITVDATDPANPIVSATGGGSGDPALITLSLPAFAVTRASTPLFYRQGTNQDRPIFNASTGVSDHTLLGGAIGISTTNFIVPFNCKLKSVVYQENIANFELSIYKTESLTNPAVDATEIFYEASAGATIEQYALSGTAIDQGNLISIFIKIDAGSSGTTYSRLFLTFEKI